MLTFMSNTARNVIEDALRLSIAERATVVTELLASIDGEPEADARAAWAAEIERRAQRALRGESVGTDWDAVRTEVEKKRNPK